MAGIECHKCSFFLGGRKVELTGKKRPGRKDVFKDKVILSERMLI
jgi:hypothetical protein